MNLSHIAPLFVAVFAVLVLGVAAGSLNAATPVGTHELGSSEIADGGGSGGSSTSSDASSPSGKTVSHVLFPNLDIDAGVDERSIRSERVSAVFLLGVGLLLVGVVAVIFYLTGHDDQAASVQDSESEAPEQERHQAATTVTNLPSSNDVYRAWRTMVEFVDANVAADETPTELARKATTAGLPEQPVGELTELFCAIRYGRTRPTTDREERARNALERIRRAVPTDDSEASSSGPDP